MKTKSLKGKSFVWPLLGCIILWILIYAVSGTLSINQLFSISKLATFSTILALAQMIILTSGGGSIDLSLTYVFTLCAYVSTNLMNKNILLGLFIAIAVGALCGLINGVIHTFLEIPAMITTLATGYIVYTVVLVIAPFMKTLPNPLLVDFININVFNISMLTIMATIVAILIAVLLYKTKFGRRLHGVGQNKLAAKYSGIQVRKIIIFAFIIGGALAGLSGTLCGAYVGGAFQDMGSTYFLPSIAAVFIGGTSVSGGKSSVIGVYFGALMMSFLTTFLNAASLSAGMQRLIQGVFLILILIASVSSVSGKSKSKN